MKIKKIYKNVSTFISTPEGVFIFGNKYSNEEDLPEKSARLDLFGSRFCFSIGNKLLIETDEGNVVYNLDGNQISSISKDFNLASMTAFGDKWLIGNSATRTHWTIDKNLNLENLKTYFGFSRCLYPHYVSYLPDRLDFFKNYGDDISWSLSPEKYGRNIKYHRDTKEVILDQTNTISDYPFKDEINIYVPLEGGQLIALSIDNGDLRWMLDQNVNGSYKYFNGFIYKQNGKELFEINTIDGSIQRQLNYNEAAISRGLLSTQPIWVTNENIFISDTFNGTLCQINKNKFEVHALLNIDSKIPNWPNSLIAMTEEIYLIDIENNLHIIEL